MPSSVVTLLARHRAERSPEEKRADDCAGAALRLALARGYCVTVARSFARKAREAAPRCGWKTPEQIAADVVPHKAASATVAAPVIA